MVKVVPRRGLEPPTNGFSVGAGLPPAYPDRGIIVVGAFQNKGGAEDRYPRWTYLISTRVIEVDARFEGTPQPLPEP
jgi:hypothetical protein